MKEICSNIYYIGASNKDEKLFEAHFPLKHGMAYNSYVIIDEKIAVVDAVDQSVADEWLKNLVNTLGSKKPSYLIIQHMEPDHSASILLFLKQYPETTLVGNEMTFNMLANYFRESIFTNKLVIKDNDALSLGKHSLKFYFAPMVHWPEVFMSYDSFAKILFSADAFGKFGSFDCNESWEDEAARYYFGIVGKYGFQVQMILKKLCNLDIKIICSLHGPILKEDICHYFALYDCWSRYDSEIDGVLIVYTSVYGHTRLVANEILAKLKQNGCKKIEVFDLTHDDAYLALSEAFRFKRIIFATTTYNMSIFPNMNDFMTSLVERNFQNKRVGLVENGSWAPQAARIMKEKLSQCKNIEFINSTVHIVSAKSKKNEDEIDSLVEQILK